MTVASRLSGLATCAEDLEWAEPPEADARQGPSYLAVIVDLLRARPGEWAIVARYPKSTTASPTADKLKSRGCEATIRAGVIYARWPEEVA